MCKPLFMERSQCPGQYREQPGFSNVGRGGGGKHAPRP